MSTDMGAWRAFQGTVLGLTLLFAVSAGAQAPAKTPASIDAAKVERRALDLYLGRGTTVDQAAAAREFAVAARAGRPMAQLMLAQQLAEGEGVAVDMTRAFEWYSAAAKQGVAAAQSSLGWMYLTGEGTQRDFAASLRWLSAAARQDDARAYLLLSILYHDGKGVPADALLAHSLLARSAELGDAEACRRLGRELLYGAAARRNQAQGLQALRKAADLQDLNAAYLLGWWHLSNRQRAGELPVAARWIAESAKGEHGLAKLWLSEMYAKGMGVPANGAKALQLREAALAKASLRDKNDFAWELAVNADRLLRNGTLAVRIMQDALSHKTSRTASHLDTLAAAHAEAGDFDLAVAAQEDALRSVAGSTAERELGPGMRERLQSYRAGRPFHEPRP